MKYIITILILFVTALVFAQDPVAPNSFPLKNTPEATDEIYSRYNDTAVRIPFSVAREYFGATIITQATAPAESGNGAALQNKIVEVTGDGSVWFVDGDGNAVKLGGGTDDQTAAEVPYTNNGQTTVEGGLDSLFNRPIGGAGIDTLWDYTALRAYSGAANAVYVNKPGLAGFFRRISIGTDNGGTVIVASNSVVWERDFSQFVNVTWFGAVPDDNVDDTPALEAASSVGNLYIPEGVFLLCETFDVVASNAGGIYIQGAEGAVLKRCDGVATTVAVDGPSTDDFIRVAVPDTFKVGDVVSLIDSDKPLGGVGNVEHSAQLTIVQINADTLFFNQPMNTVYSSHSPPITYEVGDVIFKYYDMVDDDSPMTHWDNVIFDGNRDNNSYTLSWTGPKTMGDIGNDGDIVENCTFQNIPCENIFHKGQFVFRNNICKNLNGSATHYSNDVGFGRFMATGNILLNVSQVSRDTASHNEAAFVCSAHSDSTIITHNILINDADRPANGFYGNANSNDDNIQIIANNFVRNAISGVELNTTDNSGNPIAEPGPIITGNVFYDVPNAIHDFGAAVNDGLDDGDSYINTTITGNTIINGMIELRSHHSPIIANNNIRIDSLAGNDLGGAAILLSDCALATVEGNNVYNHPRSSTPTGFRAVNLAKAQSFTGRRNNSSCHIIGNTFHGFNVAIGALETNDNPNEASVYGVTIENNILYHRDSSSVNAYFLYALIQVRPGHVVRNNTLHVHPSGRGMMIRGVSSAGASNHNGPIIYGNTILGGSQSMVIGKNNSTLDHNITCVNNIVSAPLDDNTAGGQGNTVSGNIVLPVNEQADLNPFPNIRKYK